MSRVEAGHPPLLLRNQRNETSRQRPWLVLAPRDDRPGWYMNPSTSPVPTQPSGFELIVLAVRPFALIDVHEVRHARNPISQCIPYRLAPRGAREQPTQPQVVAIGAPGYRPN